MAECKVTASINAGAVFRCGNIRIWCDALHQEKTADFSTLTPSRLEKLWTHPDFASPDLLLFTHCHPDHYSRILTEETLVRYPNVFLALPEKHFPQQIYLCGRRQCMALGNVSLEFCRLPHAGNRYADIPHYGCLIEYDGSRILIAGDCEIAAPELGPFLAGRKIDLAVLNFPWITLQRGRECIEQILKPAHLLIWHLPTQEDDRGQFRAAAIRCAELLKSIPDVRINLDPFQEEFFLFDSPVKGPSSSRKSAAD